MWGTISVAVFGDFEMMGLDKTRLEQLTIQIIGTFSPKSKTWRFAWANRYVPNDIKSFPLSL